MNKEVIEMLKFAKKLIGIKYTWWTGDEKNSEDFFCVNGIPSMKSLKNKGICCTSFINILRQYIGSKTPKSSASFRGGTGFWYRYLRRKGVLKKFDYTKDYPLGTLFLRKYKNIKDQGHVAVLYKKYRKDPSKILYGEIIHAYSNNNPTGGQVGTTIFAYSHFYEGGGKEGYYEYAILPQNWLKQCV